MKAITIEQCVSDYNKNYNIVFSNILAEIDTNIDKIIINDPIKKCRFCDKTEPEISFKKQAHAIPELIGNKTIFSNNECDSCNSKFSYLLEDHLGKYLGLWRTMMQIKGKNGIVSYKAPDGISRIDMAKTGLELQSFEEDPIFECNDQERTFIIKGYRQPYVPIAVFKSFVKMAISVMPYELLSYFNETKKWLLENNHEISNYDIQPIFTIASSISGKKPFNELLITILCRKNDFLKVPFMQMLLFFGNLGYQIIVPCKPKDFHLSNQPINIASFPHPAFKSNESNRVIGYSQIDFSGKSIVRNEKTSVTMGYEHSIVNGKTST